MKTLNITEDMLTSKKELRNRVAIYSNYLMKSGFDYFLGLVWQGIENEVESQIHSIYQHYHEIL